MTVTLDDGSRHQVHICDEHAEDATVKSCRAAFVNKRKQLDELLAQAKALGFELTAAGSGLTVAKQTQPAERPVRLEPPVPQPKVESLLDDDDVVSTSALDRSLVSVGGPVQTEFGAVSVKSHSSHNLDSLSDKLPSGARDGKAKLQIVEGRGGMPLALPAIRQDKTGTTRIRVTKGVTDSQLQRRFKDMAIESRWDRGPDFRNGYEEQRDVPCSLCGGRGSLNVSRGVAQICPKCKGSGIVV